MQARNFIKAVKEGRISDAEHIVAAGLNKNNITFKVLRAAIIHNQPILLNLLLDKHPNQEVKNRALTLAIDIYGKGTNSALEAVETLLAQGGLPAERDLIKAIIKGRISDAENIIGGLSKGDISIRILKAAIVCNNPIILNMLLDKNPTQEVKNQALTLAITEYYKGISGALEAVETLIAEGAKPTEGNLVFHKPTKFVKGRAGIDLTIAKLLMPKLDNISPGAAAVILRNLRVTEAIFTGKIKVNQEIITSLATAITEQKLIEVRTESIIKSISKVDFIDPSDTAFIVKNRKLLKTILSGEIQVTPKIIISLIAATPMRLLSKIFKKDTAELPVKAAATAENNILLIKAVVNGDAKEAQRLILNGASAHREDSKSGLKLADCMNFGIEKAIEKGTKYDQEEMIALVKAYEAAEKHFKDRFETKALEYIKILGPNAGAEKVAHACTLALSEAYKLGFADKIKPVVVTAALVADFQLDFIDKFFIRLKSIISETTYDTLVAMKFSEAIYKQVQQTSSFQELASPEIGKMIDKSYVSSLATQSATKDGMQK